MEGSRFVHLTLFAHWSFCVDSFHTRDIRSDSTYEKTLQTSLLEDFWNGLLIHHGFYFCEGVKETGLNYSEKTGEL